MSKTIEVVDVGYNIIDPKFEDFLKSLSLDHSTLYFCEGSYLGYHWNNDAEWRQEYFRPIFLGVDIEVKVAEFNQTHMEIIKEHFSV